MYKPFSVAKGIIGKHLKTLFNEISADLKFIFEALLTSWTILRKNFGVIIIYSVLSGIIFFILALLTGLINLDKEYITPLILFFSILFIQTYTTLGLYKLLFTLIDSEYYEFELKQMIPDIGMVVSFITLSLISAFVIPGYNIFILGRLLKHHETIREIFKISELVIMIYLLLRYMFCISFIVDDSSGPLESLRQSFHLTKSNIFKIILLLAFFIIIIAVPIYSVLYLHFVLPGLTIIIIYPYINIVLVVMYRKLVHDANGVDDIIVETI